MGKNRCIGSFVLILTMILGLYIGGNPVAALGKVQNIKVDENYQMSWDAYSGATQYTIRIYLENQTVSKRAVIERTNSCNIGKYLKSYNINNQTLKLQVDAETTSASGDATLIASGSITYVYDGADPALEVPQNLRIEGNYLKWDAVAPANDKPVYYRAHATCWKKTTDGQADFYSNSVETRDNKISLDYFLFDGEWDYSLSVQARAAGCMTAESKTLSAKLKANFPTTISNVKVKDGVISWDSIEGADYYYLNISREAGGGVDAYLQARDVYTENGRSMAVIQKFIHAMAHKGDKVSFSLTACKEVQEDKVMYKQPQVITKTYDMTYTQDESVLPIKIGGKTQSSVDSVLFSYDRLYYFPEQNRLCLRYFGHYNETFPVDEGFTGALIESDKPLIIAGDGVLKADCPILYAKGGVVFEEGSEIEIEGVGYGIKAKSVTINGKELTVKASKSPAITSTNDITISKDTQYVVAQTTSGKAALKCSNGQISMTYKKIEVPENGTLGADKKYVYKQDGTTIASDVKIVYATPTPTPAKPGKPANVKAVSSSTTSVTVSWDAVKGANGYEVWRGTSETGTFSKTGAVTETSRRCPGLSTGKIYYFKVRAYKEVDGTKYYGNFSDVVSAFAKPAAPAAPDGTKAVSASATSVKVSWNEVAGATGYQVWRGTSETGSFTALGSVTTTSRTCTGLTCGSTYYFKVRAYIEVNGTRIYGKYSTIVSAVPKPSKPTGVKTTVSSATAVTVSWNAVSGATGYEVWRATSASGTFSKTGAVTETSRRCPGLTTGKTYYFKVRAYKTVNGEKIYGPYSAVVSGVAK